MRSTPGVRADVGRWSSRAATALGLVPPLLLFIPVLIWGRVVLLGFAAAVGVLLVRLRPRTGLSIPRFAFNVGVPGGVIAALLASPPWTATGDPLRAWLFPLVHGMFWALVIAVAVAWAAGVLDRSDTRLARIGGGASKVVLLGFFAFPASCTLVSLGAFEIIEPRPRAIEPQDSVPGVFPVLVLIPSGDTAWTPMIVEHTDLDDYRARHPRNSFRVPEGATAGINEMLHDQTIPGGVDYRVDGEPVPWRMKVEVVADDAGIQRIRAEKTWDDDRINVGWYEATVDGISPLRHRRYFGPSYAFAATGIGIPVTGLLWLLGWTWLLRERRRPTFHPQEAECRSAP